MSKKSDCEEWGRRLDAGRTDDDLLHLAAELEQNPLPVDALPADDKTALRRQLVDRHPQAKRPLFGRLGSAASTAVALIVLAAVVVFAWLSFGSRPSMGTAVSVPRATPTVEATPIADASPTPLPTHPPTAMPPATMIDTAVNVDNIVKATFGQAAALNYFSLSPPPYLPGTTLSGVLDWTILDETEPQTAFLHLLNNSDMVIAQLDLALPNSSGAEPFQLPLPDSLPAGEYTLVVGVYDSLTQARLATSTGEMAVPLTPITIEALPDEPQNAIAIQLVTIGANTDFITDQKTMTVTIDVNLTTIETGTAVAKLLVREGEDLMRGVVSSSVAVTTEDNTIAIAIPLTDIEVQPPATLMLVAELYANDASDPPLARHTEPFLQWRYDPSVIGTDTVALLETVQLQRHTAIVTFEARIATHLESGDTANLQMYLANPNWEENREISDSLRLELIFMPSATNPGAMKLTTTPEQIRNATNTDNPILIVEMWPCSSGDRCERSAIAPLRFIFPECPMDLTRTDEIVCVPE